MNDRRTAQPSLDLEIDLRVWRKCSRRVLPILFAIFFFSHLNRVNLSYAAPALTRDLAFSPVVYGLGAGLFFFGYSLLQVPANFIATRFGVVRVMFVLMICWGLVSLSTGAIHNANQFYALRLLLGVFEAGITPVTLLFITLWFSEGRRGTAFGLFAVAMPVAGAIGGPLSAYILDLMSGVGGLSGWRWLFLLEGIPTIILAVITLKCLPGTPAEAEWLAVNERNHLILSRRAAGDTKPRKSNPRARVYRPGFAWRTALLTGTWSCFTAAYVGLFYWMPLLLGSVFHFAIEQVGWFVGAAYAVLALALVFSGRFSDRIRWTRSLLLATLLVFSVALLFVAIASAILVVSIAFIIAMGCVGIGMGAFWSVALREFDADEAPLGIGIVNASASVGSFTILYVYGYIAQVMGSVQSGMVSLAVTAAIAGAFTVGWYRKNLGPEAARPLTA